MMVSTTVARTAPASDREVPATSSRWTYPSEFLALVAFACVAVGLRLAYARHGGLAYDEYQHMHAAYLVAHGATPYADFFAHHTPLFYYFAAAVLPLRAPSFDTMIDARYLSLAAHALTIGLAVCWVRSMAGRAAALVVGILLVGNVCLFVWGTRTYLDTYAAPLLVLSAWALPVRGGRSWRSPLSGVTFAVAMLVTQKAIMAALAPAAVFAFRLHAARGDRSAQGATVRDVVAYAVGGVAALLLLPALLGIEGVVGFVRDAVVLNLHWKARYFPWHELAVLFGSDGFIYVTAGIAVGGSLAQVVTRRQVAAADVPVLFALSLTVGIFVIPVVFEEYFVLVLPFAVSIAGMTLLRCWQGHLSLHAVVSPRHARRAWILVGGGFVVLAAIDLAGLRFAAANPLSCAVFTGVPLLWLALSVIGLLVRRRRYSCEPAVWLSVVLVLPLAHQADWIPRHPNQGERARVDFIMRVTQATDPVFDGRSGYGVFRPHAYWYWFLHDEMQMMLGAEEKGPAIVGALEAQHVPVAIVDDFTRLLPRAVLDYLAANYVDSPFPEIKVRAGVWGRGDSSDTSPLARGDER